MDFNSQLAVAHAIAVLAANLTREGRVKAGADLREMAGRFDESNAITADFLRTVAEQTEGFQS